MSGLTRGQAFDRVWEGVREPRSILVAHGTEFQSRALEDWAYRRSVQLDFIRPGKPVENAFIESFNGRLRDEWLNVHQFTRLAEAQHIMKPVQLDYKQRRPHSSLGHLTPNVFVVQRQANRSPKKSSALVKSCLVMGPTSKVACSARGCLVMGPPSDRSELRESKPSMLGV